MHSDRSFQAFFVFVLLVIVGAWAFNGYQYVNRPDCPNGVLIQDDAGVFRCVSKDTPIFLRANNFGRR